MTTVGELTERIELNPQASRPPFDVVLDLPSDWTVLDTNPATWERSAEQMLRSTFLGPKLTSRERREVMGFFDQLVADCQQANTSVSLITVGRLTEGQVASLGLHVAFADERAPASVGLVLDSLPRTGVVTEIESGVGPAVLHSERATMVPPGATELVAMTSLQIFIPIAGTRWTAVIASASAHPQLTEPLEQLMRRMAASFQADVPEEHLVAGGVPTDDNDADGTSDADFEPVEPTSGAGIERGFRTMVRKRLTSDGDSDSAGAAGDNSAGPARAES